MPSNQGRDLGPVFDAVSLDDLRAATSALWLEARRHPPEASCDCPTVEVLALLLGRGYVIRRGVEVEG